MVAPAVRGAEPPCAGPPGAAAGASGPPVRASHPPVRGAPAYAAGVTSTAALFDSVKAAASSVPVRTEIVMTPAPGPGKLAPYAMALTAGVEVHGEPIADGRLVVLHDPAGQESWEGQWRIVLFASADLEQGLQDDPVLMEMGWRWLEEALADRGLRVTAFGGTVTRTTSCSFGELAERPPAGDLEIRASWTPELRDDDPVQVIAAHVAAWLDLLALITALEPEPVQGVSRLYDRRAPR